MCCVDRLRSPALSSRLTTRAVWSQTTRCGHPKNKPDPDGSPISGDVAQYFQTANLESRERIGLYRLAHDVAVSGFGNRQVLYERFFFGLQNIMASIYYDLYDKDAVIARVESLLAET